MLGRADRPLDFFLAARCGFLHSRLVREQLLVMQGRAAVVRYYAACLETATMRLSLPPLKAEGWRSSPRRSPPGPHTSLNSSLYSSELPGFLWQQQKKSHRGTAALWNKSSLNLRKAGHGLAHWQRPSRCRRLPGHHSRRSQLLELLGRGRFSRRKSITLALARRPSAH